MLKIGEVVRYIPLMDTEDYMYTLVIKMGRTIVMHDYFTVGVDLVTDEYDRSDLYMYYTDAFVEE